MRRLLSLAALLAAASFPVLADERMEHAEWASEFRDGTGEASTKDISMARFGMLCTEDSCRFYYENGINCEPGNNYPIVIATSAGSIAVETVCAPATTGGEASRYWFADLPQFYDALMQSDTIGVAFPLSNGQFRISQFLMNGFGEATERVSSALRARKAEREARETAERERRAREAAERARKAQEAAERALKAQEAAERARKQAEQEAAERARLAAEREAAEREAAERARLAAEQEAAERARQAAEQEAAEQARQQAEQDAAERARLAAEEAARAVPATESEPSKAQESLSQESPSQNTAPAVVAPAQESAAETPAASSGEASASGGRDAESPSASTVEGETSAGAASDAESVKPAGTESPRGKRLPARM